MMKYILVIDHIATGGAERILIDYYHYLKQNGHVPYVFVLSGYSGQSKWTENVDVFYGSCNDENNLIKKTLQQFNLFFRLKKIVADIKPDVIFSFLEKSNLLTILVPTSAVKVVSVHNVLSLQYTKIKLGIVQKLTYCMIRWMYNKCNNVVAVSKQVKDDLIVSFGVRSENINVINNYVNSKDIKIKSQCGIDDFVFCPDKKFIMNIGRFSEQKAQWKLLKAFSLYLNKGGWNVYLVLMGEGEYMEELKQLAKDLGVYSRTIFLPFNLNPYKYMAHADLFVLSSIFEGFPIVLAEVSSLRIPFVGTRKAIPEEMFDNRLFWEECIVDNLILEKDFTTIIHDDEKHLAKLIERGIDDDDFRKKILNHTKIWEENNDKSMQFLFYDAMCRKVSTKI